MAYKSFRLGGLKLSLNADRTAAGVSLSFSGPSWDGIVNRLRGPRRIKADGAGQAETAPQPERTPGTLAEEVAGITWYHTIELAPGLRTPGQFDHQPLLPHYRLPERLDGQRVLDVATFDGFWAFEFERRGAREVVALDLDRPAELDWPPKRLAEATPQQLAVRFGRGFALAQRELKSAVRRVGCNVYDLRPESFGMFDIVHAGDFLLHINSPVRALQNIAAVCSDHALISEVYFPQLEHHGSAPLVEYRGAAADVTWWHFSLPALERMVLDAGFRRVEVLSRFKYGPRGMPQTMHHAVLRASK